MGRKEWTDSEVKYMKRYYLRQPVEDTAAFLNRSIFSVKGKARNLGLNYYYGDLLSAKIIAKSFNSDVSVVLKWINKYDLKCRKVKCHNQTRYLIDIEDFWKWAKENKKLINWSKYESKSLLPEPKWLAETIDEYTSYNHRKKLSSLELEQIKMMQTSGMSNKDIANAIGRTYYAVLHISKKLWK